VGYVTIYGNHLGDPRYVLVLEHSAFVLSIRDAVRAKQNGIPHQVPGAMTDRERELAHEAWTCRELAAARARSRGRLRGSRGSYLVRVLGERRTRSGGIPR
jgi:hypothetical protein